MSELDGTNLQIKKSSVVVNKTFTWIVCEECGIRIIRDLQDHERIIVKNPSYAFGECSICYGPIHYKITVQPYTHDWLKTITFKKEVDELRGTTQ